MVTPPGSIDELRRIAPDLAPSIAKLTVPAYILDRNAVIRWLNKAFFEQFGDLRGMRASHVVAPEDADRARREFAGKLLGTIEATDATTDLRTADGRMVRVDISSTQLIDHGAVVGVFGLADPIGLPDVPAPKSLDLTPRQLDVLRHLAAGHSTERIAQTLGIAQATVRNHVRGILTGLDAHTKLEAVIRAHELSLV